MKHKRKRPKNRRAGCLMCKPHKANGQKHWLTRSEQRRILRAMPEPDAHYVRQQQGDPYRGACLKHNGSLN